MQLSSLDILIIVCYFLVSLAIGFWASRNSGKSSEQFFLGGRNMPWWLAGISMVATTFAADTPLAVTELVAEKGIAGNWLWWNMLLGGMLTVFFFARYWRRAGIQTDLEFIELRYAGKAAAWLRGIRAIYLGLFINALIIAWVNLALMSLLEVFFDLDRQTSFLWMLLIMALVAVYTAVGGLMSVASVDVLQFALAIVGTTVLAYLVVTSEEIGGLSGLVEKVPSEQLNFFPTLGAEGDVSGAMALGIGSFLAFAGVQWWASWYPGAEPGGGGYVAQRMMAAKNEKHAFWATFLFQAAHYCLRPWPWILTALAASVLYPQLEETRLGYVMVMKDYLPDGLRGVLLAAFLAAYMSTISTQLNWGAGYLVHDGYLRFLKPLSSSKHQILVSRLATVFIMLVAALVTLQIESISGVWAFILECGAGLGLVLILRWYWWRINAWAELTATLMPFFVYGSLKLLGTLEISQEWLAYTQFPQSFFLTVGITTISWLLVMYLTPAESEQTLRKFVEKIKPAGVWGKWSSKQQSPLFVMVLAWLCASASLYALLFGIGYSLLGKMESASLSLLVFAVCTLTLFLLNRKFALFSERVEEA